MNQDLEHLRLLSIFHYVLAGIGALFSCFPILHLVFGLVMCFAPEVFEHGPELDLAMTRIFALVLVAIPAVIILTGWTIAFCIFLAGRYLVGRRHYTFCLVMAGIICLFMPFGTVLGVLTIIVLVRPSVKSLFDQRQTGLPDGPSPVP